MLILGTCMFMKQADNASRAGGGKVLLQLGNHYLSCLLISEVGCLKFLSQFVNH
jgi:hypothetical protein